MPSIAERIVDGLHARYARIPRHDRRTLALRTDEGPLRVFGDGDPEATLVVRGREGMAALASMDLATVAAAYVNGAVDVEGPLQPVLSLRTSFTDRHPLRYLMRFVRPLLRGQVRADRLAIPEHYDRDPDFFLTFLDTRHRCYSQGVFAHEDEPLEDAITRKLEFALESVGAREGDRVLDIGGGWGAMTEFAGRRGIRVTSLTISEPSRRYVQEVIDRERLPCEVRMEHFFEHVPDEPYDHVLNLGVTEHLPDYARTLAHYDRILKPGGKVYLDASASRAKYDVSSFVERYLYPGNGSLLCLHEYLTEVARSPFEAEQVLNDRVSYGLTTRRWAENLDRARETVEARWGAPLHRLFRLYLWACVDAFERDLTQAYRVVLSRPRGRAAAGFRLRAEPDAP
jgi:cyclopropane-fatty-acyl-phospholipid synthase